MFTLMRPQCVCAGVEWLTERKVFCTAWDQYVSGAVIWFAFVVCDLSCRECVYSVFGFLFSRLDLDVGNAILCYARK